MMTYEQARQRLTEIEFNAEDAREQRIREAARNAAEREPSLGCRFFIPWQTRRRVALDDTCLPRPDSSSYLTLEGYHPGGRIGSTALLIEEQMRAQLKELGL